MVHVNLKETDKYRNHAHQHIGHVHQCEIVFQGLVRVVHVNLKETDKYRNHAHQHIGHVNQCEKVFERLVRVVHVNLKERDFACNVCSECPGYVVLLYIHLYLILHVLIWVRELELQPDEILQMDTVSPSIELHVPTRYISVDSQ